MSRSKKYSKILRARELRKEQTSTEQKLWPYLRDRNFLAKKFRRQHIIDGFILDFYCPDAKLAIELDGPIHARRVEYDRMRQQIIEESGITVLRFKNKEIDKNLKSVLKTIKVNMT